MYPNMDVAYIVKHQQPTMPGLDDSFSKYPHFSAKLYSCLLSLELEIVHPDWVLSHYAQWAIDKVDTVVLLLSCVH